MLIDRYKQILQEPAEEVIMGSLLFDDFAELSDVENETNICETPQNRKRKPDKVNEKTAKKSNQETDQPSCSRSKDIRTFSKALPKEKKNVEERSKKSNVIVID